ncbi:MAG: DUF4382 domain-containing protein [Pseudomonadota bacterium]|nr:DUF4382 domain-containing protein [Pseudomonadota bacterium]
MAAAKMNVTIRCLLYVVFSLIVLAGCKESTSNSSAGVVPAPANPETGTNPAQPINGPIVDAPKGWLKVVASGEVAPALSTSTFQKPKDSSSGTFTSISMTITEVSVYSEQYEWQTVTTTEQTVDLINLSTNAVSVLGNVRLPAGTYNKIRLKLKEDVTGIVDGKTVAIKIPSSHRSGLKLNGTFTVVTGQIISLTLRFNPDKSIHQTGNGKYILKPVIRIDGMVEDSGDPTIAIVSPASQITNQSSQTVRVEYNDQTLVLSSLSILINGVESKHFFSISDEASELTANFQEGVNKIEASISDQFQNKGVADPVNLTIDKTAPIITAQVDENQITNQTNFSFNVVIADATSVTSEVKVNGIIQSSISGSSFVASASLLEGSNTISIKSTDSAQNSSEILRAVFLDTILPVLSGFSPFEGEVIYKNSNVIEVSGFSNEALQSAKAHGVALNLSPDKKSFFGNVFFLAPGEIPLAFEGVDLAGNLANQNINFNLTVDQLDPTIAVIAQSNFTTKISSYQIRVDVVDSSPILTKIVHNGSVVFQTAAPSFVFDTQLIEGLNNFHVMSEDRAGNDSEIINLSNITLDSVAPIISLTKPQPDEVIRSLKIDIAGTSSEPLSSVTANGVALTLNSAKTSFSGFVTALVEGPNTVNVIATDLIGNTTSLAVNVDVQPRLLIPELVMVGPGSSGNKLTILGGAGAVRAGIEVKVQTGLFKSFVTTSSSEGSFSIETDFFNLATLTVTDNSTSESASMNLSFIVDTKLSGSVRDTDDNPLPGVIVSMIGLTQSVTTDAGGMFVFPGPISTGDQTILIDPSTIPVAVIGTQKRYNKVTVPISIGLSQSNVLARPIYLAPQYIDGTETVIAAGASAIVTSPHAPGVSINIPSGVVQFPDGTDSGSISIGIVSAEKTTVPHPEFATPTTVVSLEPSGLKFSEPVALTLPNDHELPAETNM